MKARHWALLTASHAAVLAAGFALGVYFLPILSAPRSPAPSEVRAAVGEPRFTARFERGLAGSDALHWAQGEVRIGAQAIGFEGAMAPGPAYKLYLVRGFVETEEAFARVRADAVALGDIKTFDRFVVPIPPGVDVAQYDTVLVWCEAFSQFISAAKYR
jgi:hypothetical protein